jgi:Flp pilus assembly protein TadD
LIEAEMTNETTKTNRGRPFVAAALVLVILGLAVFLFARWLVPSSPDNTPTAESSDPRRAYRGPYRNIHPDVRYVGDAACFDCHKDIAQSYARHPMGRSLVRAEDVLDRQSYVLEVNNPFTVFGRRFQIEREGNRLFHRQALLDDNGKTAVELTHEVHWVIGSGAKGYSYLTEQDGYLMQTPISWFTHQKHWDLSPGFGPSVLAGRMVPASCLFCHSNRLREHPQQPDRFVPPVFDGHAIGCERCHGPGELHAAGDLDHTIVNPGRLTPQLRDAVCEQCHLEGEARLLRADRALFDYRPGLPANDFWAVLVQEQKGGGDAKAVNHVEQMYQSKCFSHPVNGVQLGCITCHDPHVHVGPNEREVYYRNRCLKCHDETKEQITCSRPLTNLDRDKLRSNCIACHMPHYTHSDIPHTASTDHRIVRRPREQPIQEANLELATFVDFYRDRFSGRDAQVERNLGLALVKMMNENMLQPQRHADDALRLLEAALARDPADDSVREGKLELYLLLHRPSEALAEVELLLKRRPENWQLLFQAAAAAQSVGQADRAREYWQRGLDINPFVADYQLRLVSLLIRAGKFDEARKHCEQVLRFDPFNVSGRQAWIGFLLEKGRRDEAKRNFEILRLLKPPDLPKWEEWFRQQLR